MLSRPRMPRIKPSRLVGLEMDTDEFFRLWQKGPVARALFYPHLFQGVYKAMNNALQSQGDEAVQQIDVLPNPTTPLPDCLLPAEEQPTQYLPAVSLSLSPVRIETPTTPAILEPEERRERRQTTHLPLVLEEEEETPTTLPEQVAAIPHPSLLYDEEPRTIDANGLEACVMTWDMELRNPDLSYARQYQLNALIQTAAYLIAHFTFHRRWPSVLYLNPLQRLSLPLSHIDTWTLSDGTAIRVESRADLAEWQIETDWLL